MLLLTTVVQQLNQGTIRQRGVSVGGALFWLLLSEPVPPNAGVEGLGNQKSVKKNASAAQHKKYQ